MHNKWALRRIRNDNSWSQHYQSKWHHRQVSKGTRKAVRLELQDWEVVYGYERETSLPEVQPSTGAPDRDGDKQEG